jgi:hypothetical protein
MVNVTDTSDVNRERERVRLSTQRWRERKRREELLRSVANPVSDVKRKREYNYKDDNNNINDGNGTTATTATITTLLELVTEKKAVPATSSSSSSVASATTKIRMDAVLVGASPKRKQRVKWTADEDAKLIMLKFHQYGGKLKTKTWLEIAAYLPGRNGKQCRERFINCLDPELEKGRMD